MKINNLYNINEIINIESYLKKNNIIDTNEYLNPTNKYLESPFSYSNMKEAVQTFKYHYLQKNKVYILCDSGDTDGITSTVIMYQYMKFLNSDWDIKILIHSKKQRGLQDDDLYYKILENPRPLLLILDSGTNDKDRVEELFNLNITTICCDHHQLSTPIEKGILISNQIDNLDIYGSGCLVTFQLLKALDIEFNFDYSKYFIDMVALSIISDSCNVTSMQNRIFLEYGLFQGINNLINPFLKQLFIDYIGYDKDYNQRDISFSIIPKINSICRSKGYELKEKMILAFLGMENLEEVSKICQEWHKTQIETVNKFIEEEFDNIDKSHKVILFSSEKVPASYSGLLASKIKDKCDNKPTLIGKSIDGVMIGSLRSDNPMRELLDNCKYVDMCSGHECQAGIQIQEKNISLLLEYLDSIKFPENPHIDVLKSYTVKSMPNYLFSLFQPYNKLWGNGMSMPYFHIHSIIVRSEDISILGTNKRTLKWKSQGIDFLIFNCTKKDKENLGLGYYENDKFIEENKKIKLDIEVVGMLQSHKWKSCTTNQCVIDKISIKEYKKKGFNEIW